MSSALCPQQSKDLIELVTELTTSGSKQLDKDALKRLTKHCRQSPLCVEEAYHQVLRRLQEHHSQIRLSALQIINELFCRAHSFRTLVINQFELIVSLTNIINPNDKLPLPKYFAEELSNFSCRCFINWNSKFGEEYPKLRIGFNYLRQVLKLKLTRIEDEIREEEAVKQREEKRLAQQKERMVENTIKEFKDLEDDVRAAVTASHSCLDLLVPNLTQFDVNQLTCSNVSTSVSVSASSHDLTESDTEFREFGIPQQTSIDLHLDLTDKCVVTETPDNREVIRSLLDNIKLIKYRYLSKLRNWVTVIKQCGVVNKNYAYDEMCRLTENCSSVMSTLQRLEIRGSLSDKSELFDSSDDEFEDVTKVAYEEHVVEPEPPKAVSGAKETKNIVKSVSAPKVSAELPSTSRTVESWRPVVVRDSLDSFLDPTEGCRPLPKRSKTADVAKQCASSSSDVPVIPYGIDLKNWGQVGTSSKFYRMDDGMHSQGFRPSGGDQEIEVPGSADVLSMRTFVLQTDLDRVTKTCRFPLPGGALCSRQDRVRCPFHGPIQSRDDCGQLVEGAMFSEVVTKGAKSKSKKFKETKTGGLIDIKKIVENPRSRVEKKVTKKSALRRVAKELDKIHSKKCEEKFGNQFNYQCKTFL